MNPLDIKSIDDLKIISEYSQDNAIPEKEYFAQQDIDSDLTEFYPLGENAQKVFIASYKGKKLLMQQGKSDLYIIANLNNFGFSLVHYILQHDNKIVRLSDSLPIKQLYQFKEVIFMNNNISTVGGLNSLQKLSLNGQLSQNATQGYQPIQPQIQSTSQQQVYTPQAVETQGTGITQTSTSRAQIANLARAYGYVIGYIVQTGPHIDMKLAKQSSKKNGSDVAEESYSIRAIESKPSKVLRVLAALPKGICMKEGRPASADEVYSGNIDFNENAKDLNFFAWKQNTAVAYIGAVGKALPEYAPTHTDRKEHYSPRDILENKINVGYVEIVSRENRNLTKHNGAAYLWSLKSTSRRSLFTTKNFMPLSLFKHIPITCKTVEDAYRLNKIAFGGLDKKQPKTQINRLELAYNNCPQTIYKREYEIIKDGQKVKEDGIGSIYFMAGESDKVGEVEHPKAVLTYIPWNVTAKTGESPETQRVTRITYKEEKPIKSDPTKTRMTNVYYKFSDNYDKNKGEWKPYEPFLKYATSCISIDDIKALTSKDNRRNSFGNKQWSADIQNSFLKLTKSEEVVGDHELLTQKYEKDSLLASL